MAAKKTTPVALNQEHNEVLDFTTQYHLYLDDAPYSYPTLTVEDAEWILEASFNYEHMLVDFDDTDYGILHGDEDTTSLTTGRSGATITVSSAALFEAYDNLYTAASSVANIAPMSDVEISTNSSGDYILRFAVAQIYDLVPNLIEYPGALTYSEYHRAVGSWQGPGGQGSQPCLGVTSSKPAFEAIQHNLRYAAGSNYFATTGNSGYYYSVGDKVYGDDPFDGSSYTGPLGQDYTESIWGSHGSINSPSYPSTGEFDQCLSAATLQHYEAAMNVIEGDNTLLPAKKSWAVYLTPENKSYTDINGQLQTWHHHKLSFKTGILRTP